MSVPRERIAGVREESTARVEWRNGRTVHAGKMNTWNYIFAAQAAGSM
jgi:hypothetical protein